MRFLLPLALLPAALAAQTPSPIQADAIREDVRILSSDEFLGRGPGERGLHVEEGLQPGVVGDGLRRGAAGEGAVEQSGHGGSLAQTAKKTVSPSPRSLMSRR